MKKGGTTSLTDTLKEQVTVLPEASVAVYTTIVSPVGKTPGLRFEVKVTAPQLSVIVGGVQFKVTVQESTGSTSTNGGGQPKPTTIMGLVVSATVTVKVQTVEFPKSSVAV